MKHLSKTALALLLSILLCIPAAIAVFYYSNPMTDASYDLTVMLDDGQTPEEWQGNKGWTIFTDEKGVRTELTPDGTGGYSGISYPGQTFYYSRELTEELDVPTIKIMTANYSVSIFLDGELLYTDCPSLDNRIGYLTLPMQAADRTEPVTVSLPQNYAGRTLTIAQSTPENSETGKDMVYPLSVTLYCGYSYESGLIASASQVMIPAILLFALMITLLFLFIWKASLGSISLDYLLLACTTALQMGRILVSADFSAKYFGNFSLDVTSLLQYLSVLTLLLLLATHEERLRPLFLVLSLCHLAAIGAGCLAQLKILIPYGSLSVFLWVLPLYTGFLSLTAAVISGFFLARKGNPFFRRFSRAAAIFAAGFFVFWLGSALFYREMAIQIAHRFLGDFTIWQPTWGIQLMRNLCLFSAVYALFSQAMEHEAKRRTENAVILEKSRMAVESYQNLRRQSEEIMMIRHDTARHYKTLQTMLQESPERLEEYLTGLVGEISQVRPVISTGNQMLDILLNGKLNTAAEQGISVEVVRSAAPEVLPLRDTELCSLVTNILDNAIDAAASSGNPKPFLRLDLHCKDRRFVFVCENSAAPSDKKKQKEAAPEHGYGLQIIKKIMHRWGDMVFVENSGDKYSITVVLPMSENSEKND